MVPIERLGDLISMGGVEEQGRAFLVTCRIG
jgi:hypothetical protein